MPSSYTPATNLHSPGPIGDVTPSTIAGTTITASTLLSTLAGDVTTPAITLAGVTTSGFFWTNSGAGFAFSSAGRSLLGVVSGNTQFRSSSANAIIAAFNGDAGGTQFLVGEEVAGQYFGFIGGSASGQFHRIESTGEVYFLAQNNSGCDIGNRLQNAGNKFYVRAGATPTANIQEWQNSIGTALASVGPAGTVKPLVTTVTGLPSAATAGIGSRAFVTDALTTVILGLGTTVANGGSNKVPVYSDGTNWIYG